MKIHSDVLTSEDVSNAIRGVDGAWIESLTEHGSHSRNHAFNVKLVGTSNRLVNSGQWGAGYERAATWDQWGEFLAALYEIDPKMLAAGMYTSREHFHERTEGKFA